MKLQPGARLRSQVSSTEVIVVSCGSEDLDLQSGGYAMVDIAAPEAGPPGEPADDVAVPLGKRYRSPTGDSLEILVTKAGVGTLTLGGVPLEIKPPKALPASD